MPLDLIDADTHAERLARLQASLTAAQRQYDQAVFEAETGDGSESAVKSARQNIQEVRDRIDALTRAREVSKAAEAEEERRQIASTRKARADATLADAKAVKAAASKVQKAIEQLIQVCHDFDVAHATFADGLNSQTSRHANGRMVHGMLGQRFDGTFIVGHLRAASIQALDTLETPLDAMHAWKDQTFTQLISGRVDKILQLAASAAPDLKD